MKHAQRSHTLSGEYLERFFRESLREGRDPRMVIIFGDARLKLDIIITREI